MELKPDLSFSFYLSVFSWLHLWFFSFFLIVKKRQSTPNKILSLFLFCFSFIHIQHVLLQSGILWQIPFFDPLCGIVLSTAGPLFYFYTKSLIGAEFIKKDLWHGIVILPGTIHFLILIFTKNGSDLTTYYYTNEVLAHKYTPVNLLLLCIMLFYFVGYLLASVFTIKKYLAKVNEQYSKIEKIRLNWLKDILLLLIVFSFVLSPIVLYVANAAISSLVLGYFSTFIYFIIIYKSLSTSVIFTADLTKFATQDALETPKYTNSTQSLERILEQGKLIEGFLTSNQLLYNENLSLKQMANELDMPPYVLSEIINRYFDKSFFDLVNSARINRAKAELLRIDTLNITIEGVGYSCGFGSKAAFYRAFKKSTGLTPTAYLKEQAASV